MSLIAIEALKVQKRGAVICDVPSLAVETGETVAIVGDNGSGKTTLLRVLAGLESDYGGTCQVGIDRLEVVFVHQSPYLFRGTVLSNVSYGPRARGGNRADYRRSGLQWLERCGAAQLAGKTAAHLSGGERKRVALARALAIEPKLILLDEPLEELDAAGTEAICRVLGELATEATVIVTSPATPPPALSARLFEIDRS